MRKAEASDLAQVEDITRRAYEHYIPIIGGEPLPMLADYAPRIAAGEVWLHEDSGGPAALIAFEDHGDHLHIFSVAVRPAHQSKGIGRELLAFAESIAHDMDRPALSLCTHEKMERNIGIYRRFGFTEIGRRTNPNRAGSIIVDMEKTLGADNNRRLA